MSGLIPIMLAAAIFPADNAMWQMNDLAYQNPAVKQWMLPSSFSEVYAGYHHDSQSEATLVPGDGTGSDYWSVNADTYMKYKSSTLWGTASYRNGHVRDVVWNETSDAQLLYPYLTADSVGGDLSMERYSFSGGYADHSGRWSWGGALSYTAGLYYRNVDPRPKNITGLLDISVGGGYALTDNYTLGASFGWQKYKQDNDITFVSQLGVDKIYHLTGLGTDYTRFAGTGLSVYYTGSRQTISLNLFPTSGSGLVATAQYSHFGFDNVLTDLNKLPMAHVSDKALALQAGWLNYGTSNDWAVTATANAQRRHGYENIFGDASSNIYPQIGQLLMYADNSANISLSGLWQHRRGDNLIFWIKPSVGYNHRLESYREPIREMRIDNLDASIATRLTARLGQKWKGSVNLSYQLLSPCKSYLNLASADESPASLIGEVEQSYLYQSNNVNRVALGLSASRAITATTAVTLSAQWCNTAYHNGIDNNDFNIALGVTF